MSPSKVQQHSEVTKGVINGPRPSNLRIHKDSHGIHKPLPENSGPSVAPPKHYSTAKRQPVIIYTHSPKVIHAKARDFMGLVQKLTGMSRADTEKTVKHESEKDENCMLEDKAKNMVVGFGENESSSSVMADEIKEDSCTSAGSSIYNVSNNYLLDAPLFSPTSNSNDFFCSPKSDSLFQSSNSLFQSSNSISPSFMDYMNNFQDY